MHIAVYLIHPSVSCWNAKPRLEQRLREGLSASVTIAETPEAFLSALSTADVAISWRFKQDWFAHAPQLRLLATPAAGHDYLQVDMPEGVKRMHGSWHGKIMGETALGMILGCCRGLFLSHTLQREAAWPRDVLGHSMRLLRGAHLVICGFGPLGQWVGQYAKPFGVRVTGVRRNMHAPTPAWFDEHDRVVSPDGLEAILSEADHLFLTLPGDTTTDAFLDAHRISCLPPHAYVYNIGRGNAIEEEALVQALREERLAGACLDVFQEEPLPMNSPLRTCPRCLVMPHSSAIAEEYLDFFLDEFIPACRATMAAC